MIKKLQQGYLIIAAVIIIITIAFFAATTVYMYLASTDSSSKFISSERSYYLAQTGIERATYGLFTSNVADKVSCTDINSGNTSFTNVPFINGQFSVTGVANAIITTLAANISATDTTISLISTSGFLGSGGIVIIDREAIRYIGFSGNSLVGVTRAVNGTAATTHFSGAKVTQKSCLLTSIGNISDAIGYSSASLQKSASQIQEIWVVGNGGLIVRGIGSSWTQVASGTTANLNGISMANYAEGWVVGDAVSGHSTILHWDGSNFSAVANPGVTNLRGVWVVSNLEAWAVGDGGLVLRWDGTQWNTVTVPPYTPATNFYGISVIDTNSDGIGDFGFADGTAGRMIKYENGVWNEDDINPNRDPNINKSNDLKRVAMVSTTEVFASGVKEALYWRAEPMTTPQWHVNNNPNTVLNALVVLDVNPNDGLADFVLVAGTNGKTSEWHSVNPVNPAWNNSMDTGADINDLAAFSPTDVWAVGFSGGAYKVLHWDGVNPWTYGGYSTATQLNSMAATGVMIQDLGVWGRVYN